MARVETIKPTPKHGKKYKVHWSWYDEQGKRHFKAERFRTEREAKAKVREVEQAIADAALPDYAGGRKSLRYWAERWYEVKAKKVKPTTANSYRAILDASVLPRFGDSRVRTITAADIQEWVDGMSTTPPTIKHHHGVLRAVLAHAVKGNAIRSNPARDVELPTDRSTGRAKLEPIFLTPDQITRLTHALRDRAPYDLMVLFTAYTGLRASEVSGLNVGDVDLLRNRVHVIRTRGRINGEHVPKSGQGRRVPMPTWLAEDLRAYLVEHPRRAEADAPLFPGSHRGQVDWSVPYNHDRFYKYMWQKAVKDAAMSGVRFHDLRHTFASLMAREGVPAYRVAKYMGHKDATITLAIYTQLWDEDASTDADRLPRPVAARGVIQLGERDAG